MYLVTINIHISFEPDSGRLDEIKLLWIQQLAISHAK